MNLQSQLMDFLQTEIPLPSIFERPLQLPDKFRASLAAIARKDSAVWQMLGLKSRKKARPRRPQLFSAEGRLSIRSEAWLAIDEIPFQVSDETMIVGEVKQGVCARARGIMLADGRRVATYVTVQ